MKERTLLKTAGWMLAWAVATEFFYQLFAQHIIGEGYSTMLGSTLNGLFIVGAAVGVIAQVRWRPLLKLVMVIWLCVAGIVMLLRLAITCSAATGLGSVLLTASLFCFGERFGELIMLTVRWMWDAMSRPFRGKYQQPDNGVDQ